MTYPSCFRALAGAMIMAATLAANTAQSRQPVPVVHKDGATLGSRGYRSLD